MCSDVVVGDIVAIVDYFNFCIVVNIVFLSRVIEFL